MADAEAASSGAAAPHHPAPRQPYHPASSTTGPSAPPPTAARGARSRGRPRVRSPESARRFQRECIRQMQATRVYLGTAYQRWRSLSFLFKRTSDMAKHLLDVHERHCTACFQPAAASACHTLLPPHHRHQRTAPHDGVRLLNELQRMSSMRSHHHHQHHHHHHQVQNKNNDDDDDDDDDPSPTLPEDISIKMEPSSINSPASCLVSVLPEISCYIKQEPSSDEMSYDKAIDLTRESSGSSAIDNFTNNAT